MVPWTEANRIYELRVDLVDGDGIAVQPEEATQPVTLIGKVEVGRPPDVAEGSDLDVPLALRFKGLLLDPGRYHWQLSIDGNMTEQVTFDVLPPVGLDSSEQVDLL